MKHIFLLFTAVLFSLSLMAQTEGQSRDRTVQKTKEAPAAPANLDKPSMGKVTPALSAEVETAIATDFCECTEKTILLTLDVKKQESDPKGYMAELEKVTTEAYNCLESRQSKYPEVNIHAMDTKLDALLSEQCEAYKKLKGGTK